MTHRLAIIVPALLVLAAPTSAHHSTEVFYDRDRTVEFTGILMKLDMINPHSWFRFEETKPDGGKRMWLIEADHPSLIRRGMLAQLGRDADFTTGERYTVRIEPAWNTHEADGYLKALVLPNGALYTCC